MSGPIRRTITDRKLNRLAVAYIHREPEAERQLRALLANNPREFAFVAKRSSAVREAYESLLVL